MTIVSVWLVPTQNVERPLPSYNQKSTSFSCIALIVDRIVCFYAWLVLGKIIWAGQTRLWYTSSDRITKLKNFKCFLIYMSLQKKTAHISRSSHDVIFSWSHASTWHSRVFSVNAPVSASDPPPSPLIFFLLHSTCNSFEKKNLIDVFLHCGSLIKI